MKGFRHGDVWRDPLWGQWVVCKNGKGHCCSDIKHALEYALYKVGIFSIDDNDMTEFVCNVLKPSWEDV